MRDVMRFVLPFALLCSASIAAAQSGHDHHDHQMTLDVSGMVMNENADQLPAGCAEISEDHTFTVRAGAAYARDFPGHTFGMSQHEWRVSPCSRVQVTFVNEDEVRHQWMVHGLPRYLYPGGMFHLEAAGGFRQTGRFIVPAEHRTYLVHCDVAQHMEKGMKGQLVVGRGDGDLWSVPGISATFNADVYLPDWAPWSILAAVLVGVAVSFWIARR